MNSEKKEIQKYKNWTIGDIVWFNIWTEKRPHQGEIKIFHPDDKTAPAVSVYDLTNHIWRSLPIKFIFSTREEAKDSRESYLKFMESLRYG